MISGLFFWIFPFFLISFDLAFSDLFLAFMLFFFLESANNFSFEKALRYVVFLSLYTMEQIPLVLTKIEPQQLQFQKHMNTDMILSTVPQLAMQQAL